MKLVTVALLLLACAAPGSGQAEGEQAALAARTGGWRLAHATSPYLRAHADNPVEWYPWGPEAFARAAELDRPIFLSIGYSACHWCHRMEHDTFEDAECARLLNENFVSIKVDREERPDIDSRFMQALVVITGGGGWPASLFLTPEGLAFAGGTYFAPEETAQTPGFRQLLTDIAGLWATQRSNVLNAAAELRDALLHDPLLPTATDGVATAGTPAADAPKEPGSLDLAGLVNRGLLELTGSLDGDHGGTFGAPKFPPPMTISFLLGQHRRNGADVLPLLRTTLDAMAGGALQDHVGGGFHRYCVDLDWKVPHFEKMLADNALLGLAYAQAHAVSGHGEDAEIARRTFEFVVRELRLPDGLYASSLDADSLPFDERGRAAPDAHVDEGRVYLWTIPELKAVLGEQDGLALATLFHADIQGNFEAGRSILRPMASRATLAADTEAGRIAGWPTEAPRGAALLPWLDDCLARLAAARARRPQPFRDGKALAAQNGLLLSAFARSAGLLRDDALADRALELATAIKQQLMPGGPASFKHQTFEGVASGEPDLLDHAAVARGLLDASSSPAAGDLVADAFALTVQLLDRFEDPDGGFYDTTGSDPHLPGRGREVWDGALPSGTSVTLQVLLRLAPLDDSGRFQRAAQRAIVRLAPLVERMPQGFPELLAALEMARGPLLEIVIDGEGQAFDALLHEVHGTLLPAALVVSNPALARSALARVGVESPSLLEDRVAPPGEARAWVCVNHACLLPTSTAEALGEQLQAAGTR